MTRPAASRVATAPRVTLLASLLAVGCGDRRVDDPEPNATTGAAQTGGAAETVEEDVGGSATGSTTGVAPPCSEGNVGAGCPCNAKESCDPGYFCNLVALECVSDSCPAGSVGCHCTPGGSCDPGADCMMGFCVDVSVPRCPKGTAGCPCTPGGACFESLVCEGDVCG